MNMYIVYTGVHVHDVRKYTSIHVHKRNLSGAYLHVQEYTCIYMYMYMYNTYGSIYMHTCTLM